LNRQGNFTVFVWSITGCFGGVIDDNYEYFGDGNTLTNPFGPLPVPTIHPLAF